MEEQNIFKSIISYAQGCKSKMILSTVFALMSVGFGIVPYFGVSKIIASFFESSQTLKIIMFWIGICALGYLLKILFYGISTTLSHQSAYKILENIRVSVIEHLAKVPLGDVLSRTAGSIKSIIVDRVETIELPLAHFIPEGISNTCLPIAVFIYLFIIDWRMALCSILTIPIAAVIYGIMMRNYNKQYADYMEANKNVNSIIVEYVEGIEVVKAFNQSKGSYEKFSKAVYNLKDYTLAWFGSTWKLMNLGSAILPSTLLGILPLGVYLYSNGSLSPADLTMCIILSIGIVAPFAWFTTFVNEYKEVEYAINDVATIMAIPEMVEVDTPHELLDYSISLNNVFFSYDNAGKDVLHGIDLFIPQGSYTALCGPSGGGKSTIARLIARFWDINDGKITIGNVDIKDLPFSKLNNLISYVTQDNFLFNCSLLENIRLGNPKATNDEVYAAAKAAQCEEFISKLERGYDTDAGEAGSKLSGGEKQRIAIARAILKNAPIVILDEASAFTDPENEDKLQHSIAALTKGKTLLVIAHRLSTIKNADQIAVIKDGEIAAIGTHDDLLQKCNLYEDMWVAHIGAKNWAASNMKRRNEDVKNIK